MKSVIVEIRGKYAAALSDDGRVTKVPNRGYAVGQTVSLATQTGAAARRIAAWAASAAAVLVFCGVGGYAYYTPYSYVSIDVNPSVEYTLNRFDRVLNVEATDPEGETVLQNIDPASLSNQTIGKAVSITVRKLEDLGYLDGEEPGGIVIAASAANPKKADQLAKSLEQTVEEETSESGEDVEVEAFGVGEERVAEARELGVTPGRLRLVENLQESAADPDSVDLDEWLQKPIRDIMKATKENKQAKQAQQPETDENSDSVMNDDESKDAEASEAPEPSAEPSGSPDQKDNGKGNDGKDPKAAGKPAQVKGEATAIPSGNDPEAAEETPKPDQESPNPGKKPANASDSDEEDDDADGGKPGNGNTQDKASKGKNESGDKIGKSLAGGSNGGDHDKSNGNGSGKK